MYPNNFVLCILRTPRNGFVYLPQKIVLCIRGVSQGLWFPKLYTRHQNFGVSKPPPFQPSAPPKVEGVPLLSFCTAPPPPPWKATPSDCHPRTHSGVPPRHTARPATLCVLQMYFANGFYNPLGMLGIAGVLRSSVTCGQGASVRGCDGAPPPFARATPSLEQQSVLFPSKFGTLVLLSQGGGFMGSLLAPAREGGKVLHLSMVASACDPLGF